jgi:hypothetical protein
VTLPLLEGVPGWVLGALAFVLVFLLHSLWGSLVEPRRIRAAFASLARSFEATAHMDDEFTWRFPLTVAGRDLEVRHEYVSRGRGNSTSGPSGHLLILSTRMSARRWEMHQFDLEHRRGARLTHRLMGYQPAATGDATFDGRFSFREHGLPVREGWLDAPTRLAITRLYDAPMVFGPLWMSDQQLTLRRYWTAVDHAALRDAIDRFAAVAEALEETAFRR